MSLATVQYVTRTVDDADAAVIITELIPASTTPGTTFLCAADQRAYVVSGTAVVNGITYAKFTEGSVQAPLVVNAWGGVPPVDGDDPATSPDASYFAVGPWSVDEDGEPVTPYYAWINADGEMEVVTAASLVVNDYTVIKDGNKVITPVSVGASPAGDYTVAALFEATAERDVALIDSYSTAQKTELLKFYGILDASDKLTVTGAALATRLKINAMDEPDANYYEIDEQGDRVPALSWTTGTKAQMVDFQTGTNTNVGFVPGRKPDLPGTPGKPTGVVGDGTVTVTVVPASDGGENVLSYTVTVTPDDAEPVVVDGDADPLEAVFEGLTNGTSYVFTVTATNATGTSTVSLPSNALVPCTTPDAPTNLVATAGNTEISLAFSAPAETGGAAITNYEYSTDNGSTWTVRNPVATTSPIVITGLTNGQAYQVKLRAVNSAGAGTASGAVSSTPITTANAPTSLVATPGNAQASIAFTAPTDDGGSTITNYKYQVDSGAWTAFDPADATTPVVVTGLANDVQVSIKLRAVNAAGDGIASGAVTVTPTAG